MFTKKSISCSVSILFIGMLMLMGFSPVHAMPFMPTESAKAVDSQFVFSRNTPGINITVSGAGNGATSRDIILVIDTSPSMAYETTGSVLDPNYATNCYGYPVPADCVDPLRSDPPSIAHPNGDDPKACNNIVNGAGECEPLGTVKDSAIAFVDQWLSIYPNDRIAVIATTGQQTNGTATRKPTLVPSGVSFMDNQTNGVPNTEIQNAIRSLKVFQPRDCPNNPFPGNDLTYPGPCLLYNAADGHYIGQPCIPLNRGNGDPTSCGTSNTGGSLFLAAEQFAYARQDFLQGCDRPVRWTRQCRRAWGSRPNCP